MTVRVFSSKDDLERALDEMGEALAVEVKAYLIGGCAMILDNAKVATKDIDLVMISSSGASITTEGIMLRFRMILHV